MAVALLTAALELAEKGSRVFPLIDNDEGLPKVPMSENGFHDATTDPSIIRKWDWARATGIGSPLEPGTFAVDIDKQHDGDKTIASLKKAGLMMPATKVHRTSRGGSHRFYQLPEEYTDRRLRGRLGPGVDIKAAGKGYVVMPPTPGYEVQFETRLAVAPTWMIEEILKPDKSEAAAHSLPKFFDQWEAGTQYGSSAMEKEIGRLLMTGEGGRNNALNKAAFSLAQLSAGGELSEDEALERLMLAGERMGLTERECRITVTSGWEAGFQEPRQAPEKETKTESKFERQAAIFDDSFGLNVAADREEHFWLDWENANDDPPPFYLHPIVPKNAYVLVYGATEASKSMVFLGLACEGSHLGLRASVYSLENPSHIDIDRVRRLGPSPEGLRITNQLIDLNDARQVHELVAREQAYGTNWLIIDTYSHAFNTRTEDGNAKAIEFARRIRYIMQEVGCTVILVDHTGYADHGEPRDASAKRQQVDVAIKMERTVPWAPGQPSRWSMECKKSARFGNPFFLKGKIEDVHPGRGLRLTWDAGYEPEWRLS